MYSAVILNFINFDIKCCSFIIQIFFIDVNKRDRSKKIDRFFAPTSRPLYLWIINIKLLLDKKNGKEIDCRKNATTFRTLSDKQFRSALTTTFHACAIAKFKIDNDDHNHASELATKGTFPNALTTYLTFQQSSNTWDKSRKILGIFFCSRQNRR